MSTRAAAAEGVGTPPISKTQFCVCPVQGVVTIVNDFLTVRK